MGPIGRGAGEYTAGSRRRCGSVLRQGQHIPTLPASDWSVVRIYLCILRLIGCSAWAGAGDVPECVPAQPQPLPGGHLHPRGLEVGAGGGAAACHHHHPLRHSPPLPRAVPRCGYASPPGTRLHPRR
eukprot:2277373-Pyramimonas_sp.AAC.1